MLKLRSSLLLMAALTAAVAVSATQDKSDKKDGSYVLPKYNGPKKRIAVAQMSIDNRSRDAWEGWLKTYKSERNINTADDVGLHMTEMLTTALIDTKRFVVLERGEGVNDVRSEIKLTQELGNQQTQVKAGNVLGAQIIVRAAVTEFQAHSKRRGGGFSIGPVKLGGDNDEAKLVLDVRFIDASTLQVLDSVTADGTSKSSAAIVGLNVGSFSGAAGGSDADPVEKATRDALTKAVIKIVERMQSVPWEAKVAKINDDGVIILNRGENDGLKVGDSLKLYKAGEIITDPDSGEKSRDQDTYIGEVTITWVGPKLSRCTLSGGKPDPKVQYIVRYTDKQS
ncbi:MAG: hypothetical protein JSS72_13015 [Armatimonadetes bacterium]|nr:hypothetical protein [Armatimonadota bacterium]